MSDISQVLEGDDILTLSDDERLCEAVTRQEKQGLFPRLQVQTAAYRYFLPIEVPDSLSLTIILDKDAVEGRKK